MRSFFQALRWTGCFIVAYFLIITSIILVNRYVIDLGITPVMQTVTVLAVACVAHWFWRKGFLGFGRLAPMWDPSLSRRTRIIREASLCLKAVGCVAVVLSICSVFLLEPFPAPSTLIGMAPLPLVFFVLAWVVGLFDRTSRKQ
jgi:hypothetical protein